MEEKVGRRVREVCPEEQVVGSEEDGSWAEAPQGMKKWTFGRGAVSIV